MNMKVAAFEVREDEWSVMESSAQRLGLEVTMTHQPLNKDNLPLCEGCLGVTILGQSIVDREMLTMLRKMGLRCLSTRTIGYNHIDLRAARELDVLASNVSYAPNGVADYTVMLILMLLRKYKPALYRANVNDYSLAGLQGRELRNLTVGIVGTGSIGAQTAINLSGFGCRILAYSRSKNPKLEGWVEYTDLQTLYRSCDVISYHMPLTESTYHMVNRYTMREMKDGVILVNCARGELMDISDVIDAIEQEKIGALGMDVFENETGIYHQDRRNDILSNRDMAYIRQFPNVIMTQHMAFYTQEAVTSMVELGLQNLKACAERGTCDHLLRL